jgi:hypothetical protein
MAKWDASVGKDKESKVGIALKKQLSRMAADGGISLGLSLAPCSFAV